MSETKRLPNSLIAVYSCGIVGCSMLINMISVIILYFFVPTQESGMPTLVFQGTIIGSITLVSIITSGGRLIDALYDPFIAQKSDKSGHKSGRRIPFMKWSALPAAIFCVLVFIPLTSVESSLNAIWMAITLVLFFVSATTYMIPYLALLPELAQTTEEKVKLSTWQSVGYVFGIALASNTFNVASFLETKGFSTITALQITIAVFSALALIFMLIPVFTINERKWSHNEPTEVKLFTALGRTLRLKKFRLFLMADFSFNLSIALIQSGLIFFVTILLPLDKEMGNKLMMVLVAASFVFYPFMNKLQKRFGFKWLISVSLIMLGVVFIGIYYLGVLDINPLVQIYSVIAFASIPMATLNVLPIALLATIIKEDSDLTGENKEAMFFAVRYFFVKLAQTFGIGLFAMFLTYGKEVGDDLGIRLTGLLGFSLCFAAGIYFLRYKEKTESQKRKEERQ